MDFLFVSLVFIMEKKRICQRVQKSDNEIKSRRPISCRTFAIDYVEHLTHELTCWSYFSFRRWKTTTICSTNPKFFLLFPIATTRKKHVHRFFEIVLIIIDSAWIFQLQITNLIVSKRKRRRAERKEEKRKRNRRRTRTRKQKKTSNSIPIFYSISLLWR